MTLRIIPLVLVLTATSPAAWAQESKPSPAVAPGDGGPATRAKLAFPLGVALTGDGALYVSERQGHRIRRIDLETGIITTIAGTGEPGFSGDGGPAVKAMLRCPDSIALDPGGSLYIADRCNQRIRRIDSKTGIITTVAGTGERGPAPDGPALKTALTGPFYVRSVSSRELLFTDTDNNRVRLLDTATGQITTVAGNGTRGFSGDGGPALEAALARPHVALRTRAGDLVIGDSFNQRIRLVDRKSGVIRTIAGSGETGAAADGTPALQADLGFFGEIHEMDDGDLLFTDLINGRLLRLDMKTGRIGVVAGTADESAPADDGHAPRATRLGLVADFAIDKRGRIFVVAAEPGLVRCIDLELEAVVTIAGEK